MEEILKVLWNLAKDILNHTMVIISVAMAAMEEGTLAGVVFGKN